MKAFAALAALALLAACASSGNDAPAGPRMDWRCDGGAAFSARIATGGTAQVFAGGQQYSLPHVEGAGARYANGSVEYWERGGLATLNGARGGPYTNCRRG